MFLIDKKIINRGLPLVMVLGGIIAFFYFDFTRYLSLENLRDHQQLLTTWTRGHVALAVMVYIVSYVCTILFAMPTSGVFMLTAGLMFGFRLGFVCALISALLGAILFFLIIKYTLSDWVRNKMGERVKNFEKGFQQDAFHYILTLRLIPVFPFSIVNLASALFNVKLRSFSLATVLGLLPATFIYVSIGGNLSVIFSQQATLDVNMFFQPRIIVMFLAMALLAIMPVVYKYFIRHIPPQ